MFAVNHLVGFGGKRASSSSGWGNGVTDFQDFSGYSAGTPGDWSLDWTTSGASVSIVADGTVPSGSGKKLQFTTGGSYQTSTPYIVKWTGGPTLSGDYEILALMKYVSAGDAFSTGSVFGHGIIGGVNGSGSDKNGHFCAFLPEYGGFTDVLTGYWNANSRSNQETTVFSNWGVAAHWVRLRKSGTDVKGKFWEYGSSEPGSFTQTQTGAADETGLIAFFSAKETWVADLIAFAWDDAAGTIPLPTWA